MKKPKDIPSRRMFQQLFIFQISCISPLTRSYQSLGQTMSQVLGFILQASRI